MVNKQRLALLKVLWLIGLGSSATVLINTAAAGQEISLPLRAELRLVAPAAPGGGWDQTARAMAQALKSAGLVSTPIVDNVPGAAGTIGLARFIGNEHGRTDALLVSGLIMLGGIVTNASPVTLDDVVPIARLTGEYEVLAVPAGSPIRTLTDLVTSLKSDPGSISWGGGSAGGSDQILAGLIAKAVGVAPSRINYIAFSGGGEALSAVLGGQVSVGVNGLAEFAAQIEAGGLRALAVSSGQRLPGLDAPTLREQGIDLEFENWRSVVAAPGIQRAERERLTAIVEAMVRTPQWQEILERYRWIDRYLGGEAFGRFSRAEEQRVRAILRDFGIEKDASNALGLYPWFVLTGLALLSVGVAATSARAVRDARHEMQHSSWRPIVLVAIGAALNLLLAERAGFVVGTTLLFWFVARAFDDRKPWRDLAFALIFAGAAYWLFGYALKLPLPAGVLGGYL